MLIFRRKQKDSIGKQIMWWKRISEVSDFLDFMFYCGMDGKKQFYRCRVKISKKKLRSKIKAMKEWIKAHRTMALEQMFKTINAKLHGYYQYYGVTDNTREAKNFLTRTKWLLYKWLNRRSQKKVIRWMHSLMAYCEHFHCLNQESG